MKYAKPTFFTSDWHIGHENAIKFDNRPFRDLDHMHKQLVVNFNKQVPKNAITYFLGDVVTHNVETTKKVLDQLNGTKILIVGNHDKGYESCYNAGFDLVMDSAVIYIHKQRVTLTHCPLLRVFREDTSTMKGSTEGEMWHGEFRNTRFATADEGQFHLHGHIHSPNGGKSEKIAFRQYDVGLPGNNYRPIHISNIESWIMTTLLKENK